jgi:hypothetical protein
VARPGGSDLDVFGLCLGGNVFGWTAEAHGTTVALELSDAELGELSNVSTAAPTA